VISGALIPGSDLGPAFYEGLVAEFAARGVQLRIVEIPATPMSLGALLAGLEAKLAADPPGILIGHSFGGLLALVLASRSIALPRLALLEPGVVPSALLARALAQKYRREVVELDRARFRNWSGTFRRVHDLDRFPQAAIDHWLEMRRTIAPEIMSRWLEELPDLYPLPFAKIVARTLIVRGASSGVGMHVVLRWLSAKLDAKLVTIDGAGHWLANERDAEIAEAITKGPCRLF
jgi:pimeloyl-ACP methyl ester carboxylesterase